MSHEIVGEGPASRSWWRLCCCLWGCPPPAPDPCCVAVPRAPWGVMVLSVWREGGGSLNSLGVKVLCPRVGLVLIFMILIYTAPTVGANASCIAMYIVHIQGCK